MKHTLFAVLATTALTFSAPAFSAATKLDNNATTNNGKALEQPGTMQNGSGANGSSTEMNPNGSSSGSSSEVNGRNCLPQARFNSMSPEAQARLKSQGIAICQSGTNESSGAMHNGSPSGSSQEHYGNFDKDK